MIFTVVLFLYTSREVPLRSKREYMYRKIKCVHGRSVGGYKTIQKLMESYNNVFYEKKKIWLKGELLIALINLIFNLL